MLGIYHNISEKYQNITCKYKSELAIIHSFVSECQLQWMIHQLGVTLHGQEECILDHGP